MPIIQHYDYIHISLEIKRFPVTTNESHLNDTFIWQNTKTMQLSYKKRPSICIYILTCKKRFNNYNFHLCKAMS